MKNTVVFVLFISMAAIFAISCKPQGYAYDKAPQVMNCDHSTSKSKVKPKESTSQPGYATPTAKKSGTKAPSQKRID